MKFNIRYNNQIYQYDENKFNPQQYGTKRLNIKINSTSTLKFGLTTNTNAQEYCNFQVRVNGTIARIARTSSLSYVSGEEPDYRGSSVGSRNVSISSISESQSSIESIYTSVDTRFMSLSTEQISSSYTGTTGEHSFTSTNSKATGTYEEVSKATIVTGNVLNSSSTAYLNIGNGVVTYPSQPSISDVTQVNGYTTSRTSTSATALYNTVSGTNAESVGSITTPTYPGFSTVTNVTGSTVTFQIYLNSSKYVYYNSSTNATSTFADSGCTSYSATNANGSYYYTEQTISVSTARYTTSPTGANLGPGTSAANPGNPTWTNANGVTYVSRTQAFKSLTRVDTWYSRSQLRQYHKWTNDVRSARQFPAVGANKAYTSKVSTSQTLRQEISSWTTAKVNDYNAVNGATGWGNATTQQTVTGAAAYSSVSTTRRYSNTTLKGSAEQAAQSGAYNTISSNGLSITKTRLISHSASWSMSASIKSTTRTDYATRMTRSYSYNDVAAKQAVQTYYSSYYADRWSYWYASSKYTTLSTYTFRKSGYTSTIASTWQVFTSSCKKYTNSTYNASWKSQVETIASTYNVNGSTYSKTSSTTYYTSKTSSTISATETVHNANL